MAACQPAPLTREATPVLLVPLHLPGNTQSPEYLDKDGAKITQKYRNFFANFIQQTYREQAELKNRFRGAYVWGTAIYMRPVVDKSETVLGLTFFVNGKLLDMTKVPPAPWITERTINNRPLDEFTIPSHSSLYVSLPLKNPS